MYLYIQAAVYINMILVQHNGKMNHKMGNIILIFNN